MDKLTQKPALLSLAAQSIGHSGLSTQLPGGSLQSDIEGAFTSLKLVECMHMATLLSSGDIGFVRIGGDMRESAIHGDGRLNSLKLAGDLMASAQASATNSTLVAKIASIVIKGTVSGSNEEGDHFGFVAKHIGSMKVGKAKLPLIQGATLMASRSISLETRASARSCEN